MIHPLSTEGRVATWLQMQTEVEVTLQQLQTAINGALAEIEHHDPCWSNANRTRATKLAEISFILTRLLCCDHVEQAYSLIENDNVTDEPMGIDEIGDESLGVAI